MIRRTRCWTLKAKAEQDVDQLIEAARQDGYDAGYDDGRRSLLAVTRPIECSAHQFGE